MQFFFSKILLTSVILLLLWISWSKPVDGGKVKNFVLVRNNTGPETRSRPNAFLCYPAMGIERFIKCFFVSGMRFDESDLPVEFFTDVWRFDIDLVTKTVAFTQLPFDNPPIEASGGFGQHWWKNATAFSWTAGLNFFNLATFEGSCGGQRIVTYDFVSLNYEVTTPLGGGWPNITGGACDRLGDNVYCFGGLNCTNFAALQTTKSWTKYNIPSNTVTNLNSAGLNNMVPRLHSSVVCVETGHLANKCLIGSGDVFGGGVINEWNVYDKNADAFVFFEPKNKPIGIQHLSPSMPQIWNVSELGQVKVTKDFVKRVLVTGGDVSSGSLGTSNTTRVLYEYDIKREKFTALDTDNLFTIKQQYLRRVPVLHPDGATDYDMEDWDEQNCLYWVEAAGYEKNARISYHYADAIVLYRHCPAN